MKLNSILIYYNDNNIDNMDFLSEFFEIFKIFTYLNHIDNQNNSIENEFDFIIYGSVDKNVLTKIADNFSINSNTLLNIWEKYNNNSKIYEYIKIIKELYKFIDVSEYITYLINLNIKGTEDYFNYLSNKAYGYMINAKKYPADTINDLIFLSKAYVNSHYTSQAIDILTNCINECENKIALSYLYNLRADRCGNYEIFEDVKTKSLDKSLELNQTIDNLISYANMGLQLNLYELALQKYYKAYELFCSKYLKSKHKIQNYDYLKLYNLLAKIGYCNRLCGHYDEAIKYYNKALNIIIKFSNQITKSSTHYYLDKAVLKVFDINRVYYGLGCSYGKIGLLKEADIYFNKVSTVTRNI